MSNNKNHSAFTLVELIVVIVILAILATIAFLSFSNYSGSARDSTRLSDISNIAKGLVVQYSIGGSYILPDNNVSLYSGSTVIGYQGKAGSNVLSTIKISSNSGKDPIDNTYYTYNINFTKNKYQVTGYLESKGGVINRVGFNQQVESRKYKIEDNGVNNLIPHLTSPKTGEELSSLPLTKGELEGVFQINQVNATNYTNRYPYTKGDSIGVILSYTGNTTGNNTNSSYTPIEDNISTSTGIDISSGTLTSGKIVINNNTDSSTGVSVVSMSGYLSSNTTSNNGTCGTANGTTVSSTPSTNLCTSGTPGSVIYSTGAGTYSWSCGGASCKAYDNYTVLLLHFDDNSNNYGSNVGTITNNSVTTNSAGKFGNAAYFNGTSSYIFIPNSSDWDFGTSNFTVDFWIYPTINSDRRNIIDAGDYSGRGIELNYPYDNKSYLLCSSSNLIASNSVIPLNTWSHIALVRNGTTLTYYLNGNYDGSITTSATINSNGIGLNFGKINGIFGWFGGYIDEVRISKGIARRTNPFSQPTSPY